MAFAQARQKAGLSQAQVAKELGVDQSAVSRWETGENMPRAEALVLMAKLYGCTVDELLRKECPTCR